MSILPLRLTLIVAYDLNRVIGDGDRLIWHLRRDLQHFKQETLGKVVLMGRKTFDSIGKPLPGRRTVVITRDKSWQHEGVDVVHSLVELSEILPQNTEVMVAGGGEIYKLTLPYASTVLATEVQAWHEGDTVFPELGPEWREVSREIHLADEQNDFDSAFLALRHG